MDSPDVSTNQPWLAEILELGREPFTGDSGLQNIDAVIDEEGSITVTQIMEYFINDDLIDNMVVKTNKYANMFKKFASEPLWIDVNREEMKKFFAIILIMEIDKKPSIEHYWTLDPLYYTPFMHKISMSCNRFTNILRCWQFEDVQINNTNVLYRIQPFVDKVLESFRELYVPGDTVVVQESHLNHRGRLSIKTNNAPKPNIYEIKVYKACSVNSYTWSYAIHAGAGTALEGLDKPGSVVVGLCQPLLNAGRMIVADDHYTSVNLANYLKDRQTDLCGTLRNRKDLPKDLIKEKLRRSEVIARQKDNFVTVMKWRDKRDVLMISTCHGVEMTDVTSWRGVTQKPNVIIDYNDAKKGIDSAGHLGISPLSKSLTWYKKIACDLLFQAAVMNTVVIYNEYTKSSITALEVQEAMIRHWLEEDNKSNRESRDTSYLIQGSVHHLTQIPRKDGKLVRRRCVSCYAKRKIEGLNPVQAKLVNTECKICLKSYCLPCFNEVHI